MMQAPEWATHEVVYNNSRGESRVWIGGNTFQYSIKNGTAVPPFRHRDSWDVDDWIVAIKAARYDLISASSIYVELENK